MNLPLKGIKILELGHRLMGPRAAAHLGAMGADVIKIENPQGGDPIRYVVSAELPEAPENNNYWFEAENHNKRSITLDLRKKPGQEVAHKLIKQSDIFITNFQVYALKNLRMDYDTLKQINPRLIYAIATGWGMHGPEKDRPAYDYVIFAASGLMDTLAQPGMSPPQCRPGLGDHIAACIMDYGIMLALYHREKTGEGQLVHVSLLGALIETGALALQSHLATGQEIKRWDRTKAENPLWNYYAVKGGDWLQLAMPDADRYWADFCQALGIEEYQNDPRFDTLFSRRQNCREIVAILDKHLATKTRAEWEERLKGRTIIYGWVETYSQLGANPQLRPNKLVVSIDHPVAGRIEVVGQPVELSQTPGEIGPAPSLGQHTEEVLLELGYSWEQIVSLKEENVIG